MPGLIKTIFSARDPIAARTRVNRIHGFHGPERIDGLIINVNDGVAYVAWPDGETTVESVKQLVAIVA